MEEDNVGRQLSQVDNSVEEEVVTPVQIAANGLNHHQVQETSVVTQQTVQTSSSISFTEMKSETLPVKTPSLWRPVPSVSLIQTPSRVRSLSKTRS